MKNPGISINQFLASEQAPKWGIGRKQKSTPTPR